MTETKRELNTLLPDLIPNASEKEGEDDEVGQNELYVKCLNGSIEEIKKCLEMGHVDKLHTTNGQTPLHAVVSSGRPDATQIIDLLVKYGIDVNAVTKHHGYTALHLAIKYQSLSRAIKLALKLKDCNASLTVRDKKGRTPYDCAISRNLRRVAVLLDPNCVMTKDEVDAQYVQAMKEYYGPRLIQAVMDSDEQKIKEYIENHADPNMVNKYGAGAIHYAVTHCMLPVVDTITQLLNAGANINLRDAEGDNVLNIVLKSDRFVDDTERYEVVSKLLLLGAESTVEDQQGEDALAIAKDMKYSEITDLLLENRPKPTEVDKGRSKRLMSIISDGNVSILSDIVKETAAVNVPGEGGNYPLHMAMAVENDVSRTLSIPALLQAGADINVRNKSGNTGLHMAVLNNQPETVAQLLLYGADTHVRNREGKTAEDIAELQFDVVIMKMFEEIRRHRREKEKLSYSSFKSKYGKKGACIIL